MSHSEKSLPSVGLKGPWELESWRRGCQQGLGVPEGSQRGCCCQSPYAGRGGEIYNLILPGSQSPASASHLQSHLVTGPEHRAHSLGHKRREEKGGQHIWRRAGSKKSECCQLISAHLIFQVKENVDLANSLWKDHFFGWTTQERR